LVSGVCPFVSARVFCLCVCRFSSCPLLVFSDHEGWQAWKTSIEGCGFRTPAHFTAECWAELSKLPVPGGGGELARLVIGGYLTHNALVGGLKRKGCDEILASWIAAQLFDQLAPSGADGVGIGNDFRCCCLACVREIAPVVTLTVSIFFSVLVSFHHNTPHSSRRRYVAIVIARACCFSLC